MTTLAEALRALDGDLARFAAFDPHLPTMVHARAAMRAATGDEARAARRRFERVMFGGCHCGEVTGEALCPWCDLGLTMGPDDIARDEKRLAERRAAIEKMMADLRPRPKAEPPGATRPPNRHERRRAASRRWRG